MRQYTSTGVPDELLDAARSEGAGFFRQYWHVVLRLALKSAQPADVTGEPGWIADR